MPCCASPSPAGSISVGAAARRACLSRSWRAISSRSSAASLVDLPVVAQSAAFCPGIARGDVGAGLEQQLDHGLAARQRGHHQRRFARWRGRVDHGLVLQQQLRHRQLALGRGIVQRRPAQAVDLGAARDERARPVGLARDRQVHQRGLARRILGVHVRAAVGGDRVEHVPGAGHHRAHQRRLAILEAGIGIGPCASTSLMSSA